MIANVSRNFTIKFNGIRTQAKKDAKVKAERKEFKQQWEDTLELRINEGLTKLNDLLERYVKKMAELYMDRLQRVFKGEQISTDWVEENLRTIEEDKEILYLDDQIKKLEEKRSKFRQQRKEKRNKLMLEKLEDEGWLFDDEKDEPFAPAFAASRRAFRDMRNRKGRW